MSNLFHLAVKGLVVCNHRFLVVQKLPKKEHAPGYWELPGGGLSFGESPEEALVREIAEETSLKVTVTHPLFIWSFMKNSEKQVIGITYHCMTDSDDVVLSSEHLDYRWITREEIDQVQLMPELKKDLKKWNWHQADVTI